MIAVAVFAGTLILLRRDYRELESYKYLFGIGAILLLVLPALPGIGSTVNGARLWVHAGPLRFQPGELAKLALIVFLAGYLREKREVIAQGRLKDLGPLLVIWGGAMLVLLETNDLGSGLLYFGIFLAMLYIATARFAYVIAGAALFVVGSVGVYTISAHVRERVDVWLNAFKYARHDRLPARAGAVLDRARRLRRHGLRARDLHAARLEPHAHPLPEHGLHLRGARAGAGADRRVGAAARLHGLRRARLPHRAAHRRRLLEAARRGPDVRLRAPDVHHHRRDHRAHPADRHHDARSSATAARASSRTSSCSPG